MTATVCAAITDKPHFVLSSGVTLCPLSKECGGERESEEWS
ncbi:unnamed protein product, partial [Protopolystoma xenopodis]